MAVLAMLTLASTATAGDLLYNLDFGTPPHTLGSTPATGEGPTPRETISSIGFGTPTVVLGFEALQDQPLLFDSADGSGDQIRIDLTTVPASDTYCIETELLISAQDGNDTRFTLIHDAGQIRNLEFRQGAIQTFIPGVGTTDVGTYTRGEILSIRSEIDLPADSWTIFINGTQGYAGTFGNATFMEGLGITTGIIATEAGSVAAIDDLRIFAGECEAVVEVPVVYLSPTASITAGSITVQNEDVARRVGDDYELVFDGSAFGLSAENVDGVDVLPDGTLLLSFTTSAAIPGVGTVEDEDIVRFTPDAANPTTQGTFELFFEADQEGISGSDLNAIALEP